MDQISDLTKIKTNLAASAKPSTPAPTPPPRALRITETVTVIWAFSMEGGGHHGNRAGLWLWLLERRLPPGACWGVRHSGTVPPSGHSFLWEVAGLRRPLTWLASQVTLSFQFSRQQLGRGVE